MSAPLRATAPLMALALAVAVLGIGCGGDEPSVEDPRGTSGTTAPTITGDPGADDGQPGADGPADDPPLYGGSSDSPPAGDGEAGDAGDDREECSVELFGATTSVPCEDAEDFRQP